MILDSKPHHIAIWTDSGRNDKAAEVLIQPVGTDAKGRLQVTITDATTPLTTIVLRWNLSLAGIGRVLGDHWERGYGDLEWRGVVPERVLPWYALAYDLKSGSTQGFGVETGSASIASWRVDQSGVTLVLDVRCGGKGVRLGTRRLQAATVRHLVSHTKETPCAFAARFCRALCPSPRLPKFPVYGGNDWYYAYGNNSQESIRRDAALIRHLSPNRDNAPFMVIDAGWFPAEGCSGGPYEHGNARFPDMPGLAKWMQDQSVRPGIWIRPLLTAKAPATWQLPENHPVRKSEAGAFLDPSVPEALDFVQKDIRRLRDWGYQLIKHDFTTYDITGRWGFQMGDKLIADGWAFADTSKTTAEIIRGLYHAIRDAAGETILIGCNTVGHLGAGLFELQRTGDDTSGREWERTRKMGVNTLAFRLPQHNTFFAVDADCVGLTKDVPWDLNHRWLDLLARSGTPLFVSADPEAVGADQATALQKAFTAASHIQPLAEPLDWLDTTCPRRWRFGKEERIFDWIPAEGA